MTRSDRRGGSYLFDPTLTIFQDSYRLPEGMTRVGYDADTQTYTYRDERGNQWEGAPGNRYGTLRPGQSRL